MNNFSPELINAVRIEVGDTEPSLPMLHDDEVIYLLNKHNGSVRKASLDAARILLFKLSTQPEGQVGILSLRSAKTAEAYREALKLYLTSPHLNPILEGFGSYTDDSGTVRNPLYAGGVSKSDMRANKDNLDNNYIPDPIYEKNDTSFPTFYGL